MLFYFDALAHWHLYVALTISGFANAFFGPAFQASIPLLVPKEQLARIAGVQAFGGLIPIISAATAGVIVARFGLGTIFLIDFATFLLAVATLLLVFIPQPSASSIGRRSFADDFRFGLSYVWDRKLFVYLIGFTAIVTFFNGVLAALVGPLVLSFDDAQGFGWVYASFGAGGVLSGLLLSIWGGPDKRMLVILISTFAAGVGAMISGAVANVFIIMAGIFLFGLSYSLLLALSSVIYQIKAAPEVLGRVFALTTVITYGVQGVSTISAGPLAEGVFEPLLVEGGGLSVTLGQFIGVGVGRGIGLMYMCVGLSLVSLAITGALIPQLRRLEDYLPDHVPDVPTVEAGQPVLAQT